MGSKRIVENLAREFMLTAKASITTIFVVLLLFNFVKAYEQSHPLSQIHPIDVNLNMYGFNVTNTSYVGIGTVVPEYPLDVYGSGRFTGNLYVGGTIYGSLNGEITAGGNLNMNTYNITNATLLNSTLLNVSKLCMVDPDGNLYCWESLPWIIMTSDSIAIGKSSSAYTNGVAVGLNAIGGESFTGGTDAVAIGKSAQAITQYSIAIGSRSSAGYSNNDYGAIAIGYDSDVSGKYGIALGTYAGADSYSVAIGYFSSATTSHSIAIGYYSNITYSSSYSVAIGDNTKVNGHSYAFVLGRGTTSGASNEFVIGNPTYPMKVGIMTNVPMAMLDVYVPQDTNGLVVNSSFVNESYYLLNLSSNGTTRMIVTSTGKVGIGTSIPVYPLDVQGSGRFTGDLYVGGTIHGNVEGSITTTGNLNMNGYDIYNVKNVNATNLFASNAVGIGTNTVLNQNIGAKLDVKGNGADFLIQPGYLGNTANSNWVTLDVVGNKNIYIWDTLAVSGKVGIGTTSPASKIHIQNGDIRIGVEDGGRRGIIFNEGGTGDVMRIVYNGTGTGDANRIDIMKGSGLSGGPAELVSITAGGNVGIGTTNPTYKLTVVGDINATGFVKGSQLCIGNDCRNSWPDVSGESGWTDEGTYVRLTTSSDKVIIGADYAPQQKLDIVGNLNVTGSIYEGNQLLSSKYVPQSRQINTGTGLTGGGSLSSDLTLSIDTSVVPQKSVDESISGVWNFANGLKVAGGYESGGLTIDDKGNILTHGNLTYSGYTYVINTLEYNGTGNFPFGINVGGTYEGSGYNGYINFKSSGDQVKGKIYTDGSNLIVDTDSYGSNLKVKGNVLPTTTQTYDLGSNSLQWNRIYAKDAYFSGTVHANAFEGAISANNVEDIWVNETGDTMTGSLTIQGNNMFTALKLSGGSLDIDVGIDSTRTVEGVRLHGPDTSFFDFGYDDGTSSYVISEWASGGTLKPIRIRIGGSNAITITTDSNVGIGTTTPGTKLDVAGEIRGTVFKDRDNSGYYLDPASASNIHSIAVLSYAPGGSDSHDCSTGICIGGTSGEFGMIRKIDQNYATNVSGKYDEADLVLEVHDTGNVNPEGDIVLRRIGSYANDSADWYMAKFGGEGNFLYGSTYLGIGAGLDNSHPAPGNVGIGTTNPQYKLDVSGSGRFTGDLHVGGNIELTGSIRKGEDPAIFLQQTTLNANSWIYQEEDAPNWGIFHYNKDDGTVAQNSFMLLRSDANIGWDSGTFSYIPSGSEATIILRTQTGDIYTAGNVGIGTTSPSYKLTVIGDINATGFVKGSQLCIGNDCRNSWPDVSGESGWTDTGTVVELTTPSDSVNATSLWIDNANKRIGINTYSPAYALDVNGAIKGNVIYQGSNQVIDTINSGNGISVSGSGNSRTIAIKLYSGSGLIADSTGLSLNRSCSAGQVLKWNGNSWYCAEDENSGGTVSGSGSSGQVAFWTGSSSISGDNNLFWDNSNKRLGIGTTSPSEKLTVKDGRIGVDIGGTLQNIYSVRFTQGGDTTKYWIYLGTVDANSGIMRISGILGGHTPTQGKALVNILINKRDAFLVNGYVLGKLYSSDIEIYENGDGDLDVYLTTREWAEVNLDIAMAEDVPSDSPISIGSKTSTQPSGTLKCRLSEGCSNVIYADNSGNVGIGVTSPSEKLEVNGNIKLSSSNPVINLNGVAVKKIGSTIVISDVV